MSKSLGNGVDPLDIIASHGTDAMRFTLCHMATQTQDVRMPVDLICPHTGAIFTPKMFTNKDGYVVPAPIQECPTDKTKKMVTVYGVASGEAKPTPEMPLAKNTSTSQPGAASPTSCGTRHNSRSRCSRPARPRRSRSNSRSSRWSIVG